jgi:hypothetical protein
MAKQLIVPLGSAGHSHETDPSVKPAVENGVRTRLSRIFAMLSRYVRTKDRRQIEESYIPRKSREEESRLEFLRFLYW